MNKEELKPCEGCAYAFKTSIDKKGKVRKGCKAFKEIIENCWNNTTKEEKEKRDSAIRKYRLSHIDALRAQQEREKGCFYCSNLGEETRTKIAATWNRMVTETTYRDKKLTVNFCPVCGRKLEPKELGEKTK